MTMTVGEYKVLADKGLVIWDDACNELGLKHFLFHGTCLGMYRDGVYIKNDDVDVGVLCSDDDFLNLIEKLKEKGFVELACASTFGDDVICMKFDILNRYHPSELKFLKTFDTVTYKGRVYNVPHPVEDYLELHYGDYGDWRVPISNAPSTLVPSGVYESMEHMWLCEKRT